MPGTWEAAFRDKEEREGEGRAGVSWAAGQSQHPEKPADSFSIWEQQAAAFPSPTTTSTANGAQLGVWNGTLGAAQGSLGLQTLESDQALRAQVSAWSQTPGPAQGSSGLHPWCAARDMVCRQCTSWSGSRLGSWELHRAAWIHNPWQAARLFSACVVHRERETRGVN